MAAKKQVGTTPPTSDSKTSQRAREENGEIWVKPWGLPFISHDVELETAFVAEMNNRHYREATPSRDYFFAKWFRTLFFGTLRCFLLVEAFVLPREEDPLSFAAAFALLDALVAPKNECRDDFFVEAVLLSCENALFSPATDDEDLDDALDADFLEPGAHRKEAIDRCFLCGCALRVAESLSSRIWPTYSLKLPFISNDTAM